MAEFEAAVASGDHARMLDASLAVWAPLRTEPAVDERIRCLIVDSLPGLRSLGRYWVEHPTAHGRLGSIGVPMLAVVGDADERSFVRIAELLARDVPDAELAVLPGVDHNVAVRAADDLTRLLTEFLVRTSETRP